MDDFEQEAGLKDVLKQADLVMTALSKGEEISDTEILDMAYKMADATKNFTGPDNMPRALTFEKTAQEFKERVGQHRDMLRKTASSIYQLKETFKGSGDWRAHNLNKDDISDPPKPVMDLNEYMEYLERTKKLLAPKNGGMSKIEENVRKFHGIMDDVQGSLKAVPKSIKEGIAKKKKTKPPKATEDKKLTEKINDETLDLFLKMQKKERKKDLKGFSKNNASVDDEYKYEGFASKAKPQRKQDLYSELGCSPRQEHVLKSCQDSEVRLKQITSRKATTGGGDSTYVRSPMPKIQFVSKKLEGYPDFEPSKGRKKPSQPEGTGTKPGTSLASSSLQSNLKKHMETANMKEWRRMLSSPEDRTPSESSSEEDQSSTSINKATNSPSKSRDRTDKVAKLSDLERPNLLDSPDVVSDPPLDRSVEHDMERIKKLIQKEKNNQLRKKREDWEKNNELSEHMMHQEEIRKIVNKMPRSTNPFQVSTSKNQPKPSDFITRQNKYEKMYRKAVEGKEGIFHKEDLAYQFGVNPFYRSTKDKEDDETNAVSIRKYSGVRKKSESSSKLS